MNNIECLIFDVDGTLADTERDGHRVAFNAAFADEGLDWIWDEALYGKLLAVTGGKERMRFYLDRFNTQWQRPADEALEALIRHLHARKTEYYTQLLGDGLIGLRPGVERLIHEVRAAGISIAIATTTTPDNVHALLENTLGLGSSDWFAAIGAGDVVPAKKPAADIYRWVLDELSLQPEQCLAFEDSENGRRSAIGAGLMTLITTNAYTLDHDFSGSVVVLDQLGEPDAPCAIQEGVGPKQGWVDLQYLQQLHTSR